MGGGDMGYGGGVGVCRCGCWCGCQEAGEGLGSSRYDGELRRGLIGDPLGTRGQTCFASSSYDTL